MDCLLANNERKGGRGRGPASQTRAAYRDSIPNTYTWFVVTTTSSPPTISR